MNNRIGKGSQMQILEKVKDFVKQTTIRQRITAGVVALLLIVGAVSVALSQTRQVSESVGKVSVRVKADKTSVERKSEAEKQAKLKAEAEAKAKAGSDAKAKEEADKIDLKRNVLALATRLRQATACPSILTTQNIESSKIEHCVDLVEQIVSQGDKVVIMNTYKATVEDLKEKLKDYKPLICTGDTKPGDIDERINIFQTDPSRKVMICTWQKMGTSITLTAASYMIHMDTAWTDGLYQQTCDRIYRIGQTKPVFIYNLVCKNTIDEHVKEIVDVKRSMSDFIVDDEMNPEIIHNLCSYIEDL